MFFRANPGLTLLPCSCKEIYSRNATEELFREDECYDLYGHSHYSRILYDNKESPRRETSGTSHIFNQLKLHQTPAKQNTFEFREISSWKMCQNARAHEKCVSNSENIAISMKTDQIQRRSWSTPEANTSKKVEKSENEVTRPYSDSKLNENSKKSTYHNGWNASRLGFPKRVSDGLNYKFSHLNDYWKHISEYRNNVTLVRLQQQYCPQENRKRANTALRLDIEKKTFTVKEHKSNEAKLDDLSNNSQTSPSNEINNELTKAIDSRTTMMMMRQTACEQTCYSFKFPSFQSCSFKVARCHVHADTRKNVKAKQVKREKRDNKINQLLDNKIPNTNFVNQKEEKTRLQKTTKVT